MKARPQPADDEYDVIVIGAGLGGLATALFSALAGLRVLVLEKSELVGGASSWSFGAVWIGNNDLAAIADMSDDRAAVAAYLGFLGGGENDSARTDAIIDHAPQVLRLLREAGIKLDLMDGVNDILFGKAPGALAQGRTLEPRPILGRLLGDWRARLRTPPGEDWRVPKSVVARATDADAVAKIIAAAVAEDQLAQGPGLIAQLLVALRWRDVPIRTNIAVAKLLTDQEHVVGVQTMDANTYKTRYGVMLASGNYLADHQLVQSFDCLPDYQSWFPETHTGDGLRMATAAGAALGVTRNNMMVMLGYRDPADASNFNSGVPSVRDIPRAHAMVVNAAGMRFGNEASFQELVPALRAFDLKTRQPANLPCWMVFDSQYVATWGFAGGARGVVPEWVSRANDLESLGKITGIDPIGLVATAARFSEFAVTGIDADFERKSGWAMTPGRGAGKNASLGAINAAPFYAVRLYPTMGGGAAGIRADAHARVLNWQGTPIDGLYAAGDVAQHNEFGAGYQAGITFTSALVFAYLAVNNLRLVDNNS